MLCIQQLSGKCLIIALLINGAIFIYRFVNTSDSIIW